MKIAIPTYKRYHICNQQTLQTLKDNGIPKEIIYVFVANKDEYELYLKALNPELYEKLIIGELGLVKQRQFIENYFNIGECIVSLDDDIKEIDLTLTNYANLHDFFETAFNDCLKYNAKIWSVYPVFNPFFRKTKQHITTCLNYLIGAFFGYIIEPREKRINYVTNGEKEDVERSILYYKKDGITLRYNTIGFKTKYFNNVGGLGALEERKQNAKEMATKLYDLHNDVCKIKIRKNGLYELLLIKKCRQDSQ
jgi:hypothetical protein